MIVVLNSFYISDVFTILTAKNSLKKLTEFWHQMEFWFSIRKNFSLDFQNGMYLLFFDEIPYSMNVVFSLKF